MNRNEMYDYLKSVGMYPVFQHHGKTYHAEFRLQYGQEDCMIITEWGYIRHIFSIHLCRDEIVIEANTDDMKVNINYKDINEFEVRIFGEK